MINAYVDPEFFVRRGGGGVVQAKRRENSLEIFLCLFLFFIPKLI